jgi:hypothetical protein
VLFVLPGPRQVPYPIYFLTQATKLVMKMGEIVCWPCLGLSSGSCCFQA